MKRLVITPLQEELTFFEKSCLDRGLKAERGTIGRLAVVRIPETGITLARGGTGKAQFGVHTQHLLDQDKDWDIVFCAGAAGGLVDEVSVGAVVVPQLG